jgi:hypothetical protein
VGPAIVLVAKSTTPVLSGEYKLAENQPFGAAVMGTPPHPIIVREWIGIDSVADKLAQFSQCRELVLVLRNLRTQSRENLRVIMKGSNAGISLDTTDEKRNPVEQN